MTRSKLAQQIPSAVETDSNVHFKYCSAAYGNDAKHMRFRHTGLLFANERHPEFTFKGIKLDAGSSPA